MLTATRDVVSSQDTSAIGPTACPAGAVDAWWRGPPLVPQSQFRTHHLGASVPVNPRFQLDIDPAVRAAMAADATEPPIPVATTATLDRGTKLNYFAHQRSIISLPDDPIHRAGK